MEIMMAGFSSTVEARITVFWLTPDLKKKKEGSFENAAFSSEGTFLLFILVFRWRKEGKGWGGRLTFKRKTLIFTDVQRTMTFETGSRRFRRFECAACHDYLRSHQVRGLLESVTGHIVLHACLSVNTKRNHLYRFYRLTLFVYGW